MNKILKCGVALIGASAAVIALIGCSSINNSKNNKTFSYESNYKLIELIRSFKKKDATHSIYLINELISMGKEVSRLVGGIIQFCRDILLYKSVNDELVHKYIYDNEAFKELASDVTTSELFYYIDVLVDVQNKIRFTNSQKIYLEVGVMKIINSASEDIDVLSKIHKLEEVVGEKETKDGFVNNQDLDNKFTNLDNRINKVATDLEKAKIDEFKEKIEDVKKLIDEGNYEEAIELSQETPEWQKVNQKDKNTMMELDNQARDLYYEQRKSEKEEEIKKQDDEFTVEKAIEYAEDYSLRTGLDTLRVEVDKTPQYDEEGRKYYNVGVNIIELDELNDAYRIYSDGKIRRLD